MKTKVKRRPRKKKVHKKASRQRGRKGHKDPGKCQHPYSAREKNEQGVTACAFCGKPFPRDWREARKADRVWCNLRINGGPVKLCGQPVGNMNLNGAMTPERGLIVWMAASGFSLDEIRDHLKEIGVEEK